MHDEVDAFGRTVISKDRRVSDADDGRRGRFEGGRDGERSFDRRPRSNSRSRRPRSPGPQPHYDNRSPDWKSRDRDDPRDSKLFVLFFLLVIN